VVPVVEPDVLLVSSPPQALRAAIIVIMSRLFLLTGFIDVLEKIG
jgi:hypothetical protein